MPDLTKPGILTAETMLRMAQAEIDELQGRLVRAIGREQTSLRQLHEATLAFCAVVLQAGGTVTITEAELEESYTMSVKIDPATRAHVWTIAKKEPEVRGVTN